MWNALLTVVGLLLSTSALLACAPGATGRDDVTRYRAIAQEASTAGRQCASQLERLTEESPLAVWSLLESKPATSTWPERNEALARWDRGELRRRVEKLEALGRAMESLARRPLLQPSMDLMGLAEQSRGLASGLCHARDAVAAASGRTHRALANSMGGADDPRRRDEP